MREEKTETPIMVSPKGKNSNKKRNIIIVILVLIIVGLGGYIVYDKFFTTEPPKEEKKEETKKQETKPKEDLDALATNFLQNISTYGLDQLDAYEKNSVFTKTPTNEQLTGMVYYLWQQNPEEELASKNFTKADVDQYFEKAYGTKITQYPNILCNIDNEISYMFDSEKQAYVPNATTNHGHGSDYIKSLLQKIYSINKEDNKYILILNKLYGADIMSNKEGFYADGKRQIKISQLNQFVDKNSGQTDNEQGKAYYNTNYETLKAQSPHYKYTFEKNVYGNYFLSEYEVIK